MIFAMAKPRRARQRGARAKRIRQGEVSGADLLAIICFAGLTVFGIYHLARTEARLPPDTLGEVIGLIVGLLFATVSAFVLWVALTTRIRTPGFLRVVCTGVGSLLLVSTAVFGLRLGLGWSRRNPDVDPASFGPELQAVGAGMLIALFLFVVWCYWIVGREVLRQRSDR